jgi:hypothetical protein
MFKTLLACLALVALTLTATIAHAGAKRAYPVAITKNADGSGTASGSVASARSSADANQEVYCSLGTNTGACVLKDATGKSLACSTADSAMVEIIRHFGSDSFLQISVNTAGTCTSVRVSNMSSLAPKAQ